MGMCPLAVGHSHEQGRSLPHARHMHRPPLCFASCCQRAAVFDHQLPRPLYPLASHPCLASPLCALRICAYAHGAFLALHTHTRTHICYHIKKSYTSFCHFLSSIPSLCSARHCRARRPANARRSPCLTLSYGCPCRVFFFSASSTSRSVSFPLFLPAASQPANRRHMHAAAPSSGLPLLSRDV